MKITIHIILVLIIFAALSIFISWEAVVNDGYFIYRDEQPFFTSNPFEEYFIHIHKNYAPDLDFEKRIPLFWLGLFLSTETYETLKFPLVTFLTLIVPFYVSGRILEKEKNLTQIQKTTVSFAVAFAYLINPFLLQLFLTHLQTIVYALFPLFFYSLYQGFAEAKTRSVFLSALIASFMFLIVVHSLLYLLISFFVVLLMVLKRRLEIKLLFRNLALFFLIFIFSTAFVTLPYLAISLSSGPFEGLHTLTTDMLNIFSSVAALPKAMLLDYHTFWWPYVDYSYPLGNLFFLFSFLFSAVLITHAIFDRNEWSIMALTTLTLLFFFSKGNNPPFPDVYEFLNFKMPMVGWLIRVPTKFLNIIPFFFSLLFLRFSLFANKHNKALFYAFSIAFLSFLVICSWPFFTGDVAGYLSKTDLSPISSEFEAMNDVVTEENPSLLLFGVRGAPRLNLNFPLDYLPKNNFIGRELHSYSSFGNWSGLHIAPYLGAQYLLAPLEYEKDISIYSEQISRGSVYSLFRMKTEPSIIHIPSASYLCYCHPDTGRSIIRDSLATGIPELLIFPHSQLDFPKEHIDAADYVVVDSVPLGLTSVEPENTFSYFTQTFESAPSKTWSRSITPYSNGETDESAQNDLEYSFGKGFAITEAEPVKTSVKSYEDILTLSELELTVRDTSTVQESGTSFIVKPRTGPYFSTVTSDLNVDSGSEYDMHLSVAAECSENFTAELIIQDYEGDIYPIPIMESNGSFNTEKNLTFFVPYNASRVTLLFSSKTPKDITSHYELRSFKLRRAVYEMHGEKISSSFYIDEEGEYDVYMRLLKSPDSGEVRLYLNEEQLGTVVTKNNLSHLYWERVYGGTLPAGRHEITVEQLGGFNAINLGYVKKTETDEVNLSNKTLIYRLTGKNDFYGDNARIIEDGASSTFHYLESSAAVSAVIEVLSDGVYSLSYAVSGPAEILIDGSVADEQIRLEKGRHVVEIRPMNMNEVYVDHVTLIKEGYPREYDATIVNYTRLDPSTYSVWVNSTTPFFLSFGRGYAKEWVAWVDGTPYHSVPSYDIINAYYVEETGLNQITIEYAPQKSVYAGAILGIVGLSLAALYVLRARS